VTTRRKTWFGVGLAALAGASIPTIALAASTLDRQGIDGTALRPATDATAAGAAILLAQGGEGGEASVPESYALPSDDPDAFVYDASDEIAAYVRGVHASYTAATEEARALADAVDSLLADPTEATLAAARRAWVAARPAYLVTEAFRFYDGPIEALEGEINSWPINEAFIDYVEGDAGAGLVNNPDKTVTIATLILNNQTSDESDVTLGWHAVEFLLWGQDLSAAGPGDRPVSDYVAGQGNNDRRREYLQLATNRLVANIGRLATAWGPEFDDNYAALFLALPAREAIGRILNGVAVLTGFEFMSERLTVGLDSGDQEDEHSCFSDTTHQDFVHDLKGVANVWTGAYPGAAGPGMRALAMKVDAALATEVDGLLTDATAKVAILGDPWDRVLASPEGSPERAVAEEAVVALQALADGLRRVGDALGVLVQLPAG
jgi:putative iron-regulated protein